MKNHFVIFVGLVVLVVLVVFSSPAAAQSAPSAKEIEHGVQAPELSHIKEEIVRLHAERPELFAQVAIMKTQVAQADRRRRGRLAHVSPLYRSLGPDALLPMLYTIAAETPLETGLMPRAWVAYRGGMLEAVGNLRDPRSAPVLWAVLDGPTSHPVILRAAAEAIARLGDDENVSRLITFTGRAEDHQHVFVASLGTARRVPSALFLAGLARDSTEAEVRQAAVRALGDVANDWAWQTTEIAGSGEGEEVRAIAFAALLEIYLETRGLLREEAAKSLLLVNSPGALDSVEKARTRADKGQRTALDDLARRLENNPLNRSLSSP
ncbi:MAG: HEAT repeat domain-containing protein [Bradymonadaceae bacterium]